LLPLLPACMPSLDSPTHNMHTHLQTHARTHATHAHTNDTDADAGAGVPSAGQDE